jgi:hypothetical protein
MPTAVVPSSAEVLDLPLDALTDSPFQVKRYDDTRVRDLAETIRKQGLLQPATVRRVGTGYQLIAGHGRRAAVRYLRDKVATTEAEKARWSTIRCVVLDDVNDARAAALTAIENGFLATAQRSPMNLPLRANLPKFPPSCHRDAPWISSPAKGRDRGSLSGANCRGHPEGHATSPSPLGRSGAHACRVPTTRSQPEETRERVVGTLQALHLGGGGVKSR